jgi:hypothetical protein
MKKLETIKISEKQIELWLKEFDCSLEQGHYEVLFDGTTENMSATANTQGSIRKASNPNTASGARASQQRK